MGLITVVVGHVSAQGLILCIVNFVVRARRALIRIGTAHLGLFGPCSCSPTRFRPCWKMIPCRFELFTKKFCINQRKTIQNIQIAIRSELQALKVTKEDEGLVHVIKPVHAIMTNEETTRVPHIT
ncbi:E3 UFM1-protein ligase 1 homolog [Striga asiatica]|uniref:E3 UFM1-protein ligase 1 homolog n=1 Tax=Striga asiatica TaxID=4170 RepID=A0A5A7Q4L3_STRAF|nr:E3 UFM1-protein ligase 1 homolog [Striga asiatica]